MTENSNTIKTITESNLIEIKSDNSSKETNTKAQAPNSILRKTTPNFVKHQLDTEHSNISSESLGTKANSATVNLNDTVSNKKQLTINPNVKTSSCSPTSKTLEQQRHKLTKSQRISD
jgi:hypothetical protein